MSSTEVILLVAAIVIVVAAILAIVLGSIYGVRTLGITGLAERRADAARRRFPNARLVVSSASFFGQESQGAAQMRGSGTLIVTKDDLVFEMWWPRRAFAIPLKSIQGIETPTSFLGSTRFTQLLKVLYRNTSGQQDSMAWQVPDLEEVKLVLESAS